MVRTYGTVNNPDNDNTVTFRQRYNHLSKRQLKKKLASLREESSGEKSPEIRYISKLIRHKYKKKSALTINDSNHNEKVSKNFWCYCKNTFEKDHVIKTDFDKASCKIYFEKSLQQNNVRLTYAFPNWMKQLPEPTAIFDQSLPTYQEVTKIINKIKSSGSPCPHDHMSIIMLKRCPFLRSALHRIISHCWEKQTFPKTWKYAFTILIYKMRDKKVPSNFRPITLQPVFAKVHSSLISNKSPNSY